ncbi:unnamed protein product, partial [Prorocentrum cordatum]
GEALLLPQVVVLPMGFSWALHLCQTVLEASLGRAGFPQSDLILDGHCGCQLTSTLDSVAGAGYVDNYFVLGGSPKTVSERLQAVTDDLTRHGLAVHELEAPSQDRDFLGLSLREGRWLSLKTRNIWRLRAAIRATLRRQVVSGFLLRVLTGHITWALLLRRELLCILGATYAYVEATGPVAAPLWPAVRHELQLVHDLLPLCTVDLGAPWHGRVACADVSPFGLGVVARRAPKDRVGAIGRVTEKWRYKVEGGAQARRRTIGINGDSSSEHLGGLEGHFGVSTQLVRDGIAEGLPFEGVLGEASEGLVEPQLPRAPGDTYKSIMDMRPVVDFDEAGCSHVRRLVLVLALAQAAAAARRSAVPAPLALRAERAAPARALAVETTAVARLSLLERLAARSSTARRYREALASFVDFCVARRLDWATHSGLGEALVLYMHSEFLLSGGGTQGGVLLAAVAYFLGSFHKGASLLLPRAHRAAAAWARCSPARALLPLPRRVVLSLAGLLVHDGFPRLAICILVMFASCLRTGWTAELRGRHLMSPSVAAGAGYQSLGLFLHESGQEPGKTGVNDVSILFNREAGLNPLLHARRQSTASSEPRWDLEVGRLGALFVQETKLLDELARIPSKVMELGAFVESNLEPPVGGRLPSWLAT